MSNYLMLCDEFKIVGLLTREKSSYLKSKYEKLTDENKKLMDKHAHLILERSLNSVPRSNLASIKDNIQFLAWVMIFNLIGLIILIINS